MDQMLVSSLHFLCNLPSISLILFLYSLVNKLKLTLPNKCAKLMIYLLLKLKAQGLISAFGKNIYALAFARNTHWPHRNSDNVAHSLDSLCLFFCAWIFLMFSVIVYILDSSNVFDTIFLI